MTPLAVGTGVVVIAVAAAVVVLALIVAASMRGRRLGVAQRRDETRRDLDQARERADQAERERDVAQAVVDPAIDQPVAPDDTSNAGSGSAAAPGSGGMWRRLWK
jgi:uncharacterized membrane protein YhiD involved in acid resistance